MLIVMFMLIHLLKGGWGCPTPPHSCVFESQKYIYIYIYILQEREERNAGWVCGKR